MRVKSEGVSEKKLERICGAREGNSVKERHCVTERKREKD